MEFTLLLFPIALLYGWYKLNGWMAERNAREEEIAALEAAARHTRPLLIRSRYIGDPDVEDAYDRIQANIRRSKNPFIGPDDVYMEIYRTRTNSGDMFVDFQDWVDLVEAQHRKRVLAWETNHEQVMRTDKGNIGLTDAGRRAMNGQKKPQPRKYIFDL